MSATEDKALLWLVVAISLALAWILWPFYGAVLWGIVTAIIFAPLYRRLCAAFGQRRNLAALATVLIILVVVIFPLTLLIASMVQEAYGLYARIEAGEVMSASIFAASWAPCPPGPPSCSSVSA